MTLLTLAAAFMAGVFLAGRYGLPLPALGLFMMAALMLGALLGSMQRSVMPALIALVLLLGMFRVEVFEGDQTTALAEYHSRKSIQVRGLVVSDPEPAGAFTRFRLRVGSVKQDDSWIEASGDALVTLRASSALARLRDSPYFRYSDRLLLEGRLDAPPVLEDFDYPTYLARQGITTVMSFPDSELLDEGQGALFYRWLYGTWRRIADSLARLVPDAAGVDGSGASPGHKGQSARRASRGLPRDWHVSHSGDLRAARGHPPRHKPHRKPVASGPPPPFFPAAAINSDVAIRACLWHVALGDEGRHHGKRISRRVAARQTSQCVARPRICSRRHGRCKSKCAFKPVLSA